MGTVDNQKAENSTINVFSFTGRIRRREYIVSLIIVNVVFKLATLMVESSNGTISVFGFISMIPPLWVLFAQATKRCHDKGHSGWWGFIPFYGFILMFEDGEIGANQYGPDPKGRPNTPSKESLPKQDLAVNSAGKVILTPAEELVVKDKTANLGGSGKFIIMDKRDRQIKCMYKQDVTLDDNWTVIKDFDA